MNRVVWLLAIATLLAAVYVVATQTAQSAADDEPAKLISRPPLDCALEVEEEGDLIGYGCVVERP